MKACLVVLAIVFSPVLFVLAIVFVALVIAAIAAAIGGGAVLYEMLPAVDWAPLASISPFMTVAGSLAGVDGYPVGVYRLYDPSANIPLATDGNWSEVVFTGSLDTRTGYFPGKSLCFGMAISALWYPFNLSIC